MITGTIFYPIIGKQQQAYSESDVRHKLRGQEQAVRSSLEQRNQNQQQQHMDQENLCLRIGDCENSGVGEHTLGNDNSVTGFADQSNNTQAEVSVLPVTPTQPTPSGGGGGPPSGGGGGPPSGGGGGPPPAGVKPIYLLNLGYDTGSRNSGWEWGSSQYPQADPDSLTSIGKNSIQPPSPDPHGTNMAKVTLKNGEVYTDPAGNKSTRGEVVLTNKLPDRPNNLFGENDDVWYHWYTLFPSGYQTDPRFQVWTQWHQEDDPALTPPDCIPTPQMPNPGCTPTVEFDVDKGTTLSLRVLGHIYDHANCIETATTDCGYKWRADLGPNIGKWLDILLHVKWSNDPNVGFMEMWVNHNNVLDKSKHFATLDSTSNGSPIPVYMKQGLYRNPDILIEQSVYHDGTQVVKCPPDHQYYHPDTELCYTTPP